MKISRAGNIAIATLILLLAGLNETRACNVQMGFPDSCYKDGPRGTEYGTPWGPGKTGTVVPGTESAQERADQARREQERRAEQIRRAQQLETERLARARQQQIEAELETRRAQLEAERQAMARAEAQRLEDQRKEIDRQQREIKAAQQELEARRTATKTEPPRSDAPPGGILLSAKTAISIALVAGFSMLTGIFKRGFPGQAITTGALMSIGGLLISEFFGVSIKDGVTLAELPLFSPLGIGIISLALTYKA